MSSLKRPLAVLGLSMFITVLCSVFIGNTAFVVAMSAVAALIIIIFLIIKTRHSETLITFGIGMVAACLLLLNAQYKHDLTLSMCGENRNVVAVITSAPEFSEDNVRYYALAKLKSVDNEKAFGKIRLSFSGTMDNIDPSVLEIGNEICFNGFVYKIGSDNDSVHNSYTASGVYTGCYSIEDLEVQAPAIRPIGYYTDLIKQFIVNKINYSFDSRISGLVIGILTGDKEFCSEDVYRNFKISGAAHILAVSGLHMSIWVSVFGVLFDKLKKKSKLSYLIILLFVILTVFVADFSPSVCRAALMSSLFIIGRMIGAKADPLNSLGFAIACLLSFNVYVIYSAAFQLTFTCMLSMIVVSTPVCEAFDRFLVKKFKLSDISRGLITAVVSGVIVSLTITISTFPISAMHFGYISVLSVITNMLIIPVCAPLMVVSLIYMLFGFVPGLSHLLSFCIRVLGGYMINITGKISSSSVASISTGEAEITEWLIVVAVLGFIFSLYHLAHRYFARFISCLLALFVIFSFFSSVERRIDDYSIRLVGNGEEVTAILVYNGMSVVIGVYDRYYFTQETMSVVERENTNTVAVLPTDDSDSRFLEYYCSDLDAENIILNGETITMYDKIKVTNKGNYALVEGNGKIIAVIYEGDLQPDEYCDIIISVDSVILNYENLIYSDTNLRYGTLTVDGHGAVKVRGEKIWQSLTKKSLSHI